MPRCAARLRLTLATLVGCLLGCGAEPPPSLLLVTLDTTRVDHLSCYGYERVTTPRLDSLCERAVRFRRAWSTSSWTLPAHASLFTGLYPSRHGAHYDASGGGVLGDVVRLPSAKLVRAGRLPEERTTLAELLSARGYRTAAFVAGPWLHRSFGLLQGFEVRDDAVDRFGGRPAKAITDAALAWLGGADPGAPYFLFVNYFDPHAPYEPSGSHPDLPLATRPFTPDYDSLMRGETRLTETERAVLRDRYDAEIREMDAQLGRLLDRVLARDDGHRTLVIVTADHGEALGEEDRFGHGFWLTEELVRVPLIVRYPDERGAGTWSESPVQLVDVLPLVAAELGLAVPEKVDGRVPGGREVAIAEIYREATTVARFGDPYDRDLRVAIRWPFKLERSDRGDESFVKLDPDAPTEEPAADPAARAELSAALERHTEAAPHAPVVPPETDAEIVEALRALGYVE